MLYPSWLYTLWVVDRFDYNFNKGLLHLALLAPANKLMCRNLNLASRFQLATPHSSKTKDIALHPVTVQPP